MARPGSVPVTIVGQEKREILRMGPITIEVLEDGRNTDNRLGAVVLTIAPGTKGPPQHWHRMHDETFLILKGRFRFTTGKKELDARAGDYVVVPPKCFHTFANPFEEEAAFYNTFTPAYYVDYLRMTCDAYNARQDLTKEERLKIMAHFATFVVDPADLEEVY